MTMKKTKKFQTPRQKRVILETIDNMPETRFYSSNHVMINKERVLHCLPKLSRCQELDEIARNHAILMLESKKTIPELDRTYNCKSGQDLTIGLNVAYGKKIRDLQRCLMNKKCEKKNILNEEFKRMGVATAQDDKGYIYLCQIFTI